MDAGRLELEITEGVLIDDFSRAMSILRRLKSLGVRNALVGQRDTVVPRTWLQVKGTDPALEARLRDIARQIEGSELRPCP